MASDGRSVLGLQVQAAADGSALPGVFAVVDIRRVVTDLFDKRAPGFAVRLTAGGREVYRRDSPTGGVRASLSKTESVVLPAGEPWELEVTPAGEVALARWDQGPAIALATGLLASALIAAAVHYGTLAWRRDRMLRRVNKTLEEQIVDTRRGQGELRELSEALEARVAERTARAERDDRRARDLQLLGVARPARAARRRHQLRRHPRGGLPERLDADRQGLPAAHREERHVGGLDDGRAARLLAQRSHGAPQGPPRHEAGGDGSRRAI